MFHIFETLFAPGRKHSHEEQRRLELTREDVGDGDPHRGPIDLTSGKVVVRAPTAPAPTVVAEEEPSEPRESRELQESSKPPAAQAAPDGSDGSDGSGGSDGSD